MSYCLLCWGLSISRQPLIFYNQNFFYIRINCLSEASGLCLLRKSAVHLIQSQRADHAHRKAEYIRGKGDA